MSTFTPRIGMDRYMDQEWMALAAAAVRGEIAIDELHTRLGKDIPGREVRIKTIGIINRMWFPDDPGRLEIAATAASFAAQDAGALAAGFEAVSIAAYPYFRQVIEHVGRLLRLQGSCTPGEVHRRMFEQHGKRTTIAQANSYAFKTLVSWGMLSRQADRRLAPAMMLPLSDAGRQLLDRAANLSRTSVTALANTDPLLFAFAADHQRLRRAG